ncbi:MAG TPA: ABC transporter ATP-binding protein, partial [Thermoanaerobaculia bacterium]
MSQDETKKKKVDFRTAWRAARDLVWQYRKRLLLGLVLILINSLTGFVLPASSKFLIDDVINNQEAELSERLELLGTLALAAGLATLVQAVTSFALTQLLSVAAQRAIADMRKSVEQHVIRLPVSYFDSTKSGILISRILTDAEGIRNLVGTGVSQLVGGSITATIALGVLFYLNWKLTTVMLVVLVLFGGMMAVAFKRLRPLFRERGEIYSQVSGRLGESLGGVRIVKSYTAEKREDRIFAHGVHKLFRNVAKTLTGTSAVSAGATLLFGIVGVIMMLLGGRAILAGTMTLGDFVMYVFFIGLVAAPMIQISAIGTQLTEAIAGLDRIRELRQMATEADDDADRQPIESLKGDIEFQGVWFEYKEGVPVLRDVSFTAPAGSTTALVGSSGSGKSTLIGLVMAFNRPRQGRILVDGRDLAALRLYDYRSHLGIVMQDNFLFDGTVAENIAYGNPYAERERIENAGRIAHCDVFVDDFEKGYDTVVGERGVKLSGGQRQRVAIARAILADPKILILDEATSSLDSESEAMIQDGLKALRQGRTTFVIAHRLSTIR